MGTWVDGKRIEWLDDNAKIVKPDDLDVETSPVKK